VLGESSSGFCFSSKEEASCKSFSSFLVKQVELQQQHQMCIVLCEFGILGGAFFFVRFVEKN
jgi:hypothetical protein